MGVIAQLLNSRAIFQPMVWCYHRSHRERDREIAEIAKRLHSSCSEKSERSHAYNNSIRTN